MAGEATPLYDRGGGGGSIDDRVRTLEKDVAVIDTNIANMNEKLDRILSGQSELTRDVTDIGVFLGQVPTREQMWKMWGVTAGLSFATVGVIITALAWLSTQGVGG